MNNEEKIIQLEQLLWKKIVKKLKKQKNILYKLLSNMDNTLPPKKVIDNVLSNLENSNLELVDVLIIFLSKVLKLWFNNNKKIFKEDAKWLKINLEDPFSYASKYLKRLKNINLSDYRWSISKTTNKRVRKLIYKWFKEWQSYTEIAKNINNLDPFLFSKKRGELIAITEIWRAYEYWNWIVIKELKKQKKIEFEKKALTAWDSKVRPEHRKNGEDWWIDETDKFSWTWTKYANTGFRCRCTTLYRKKK